MRSKLHQYYHTMPDGTIKQINPISGTEVWTVPLRSKRPQAYAEHVHEQVDPRPIEEEDYCSFCSSRIRETPPEKARVQWGADKYDAIEHLAPAEALSKPVSFRRNANLFEIVTYDYWRKNYSFKPSDRLKRWRDDYLASDEGYRQVLEVVNARLEQLGVDAASLSDDEKLNEHSEQLFWGSHDLIIAGRHYEEQGDQKGALRASGLLSPFEHELFVRFSIDTIVDLMRENRHIRYVALFQNWLSQAGASFDHLHRQLVGLDEWGYSIEQRIDKARENHNVYNDLVANLAGYTDLMVAENDHAVAFVDIGRRFPTVAIFSRSERARPWEHDTDEIRGMSDLIQAVHAASGPHISTNEEWYYMPPDAVFPIPWHVLVKWRVITQAGFEGGTQIYINPLSPEVLRDMIVPNLYDLREKGQIANSLRIAEECHVEYNSLKYYTRRY